MKNYKDMGINELLLLLLIGLVGGIVSGTMGVGGGIIVVPALVFFFGFSQHLAQGTSIAVLLPPTGIAAAIAYHKKGFVDFKVAAILIVMFIIGSYLGSLISFELPEKVLKRAFGVFMLFVAVKMIISK